MLFALLMLVGLVSTPSPPGIPVDPWVAYGVYLDGQNELPKPQSGIQTRMQIVPSEWLCEAPFDYCYDDDGVIRYLIREVQI